MKKKLLPAIAALVLLGLACALWLARTSIMAALFLPQNPGSFDRSWAEAVVQQVRGLGIAPGETKELRLDDLAAPKSLRPRRADEGRRRGQGAGNVWAERTPAGALKVVIETRDLGHAGEYGFAYSEAKLVPQALDGDWQSLDLPGHLTIVLPRMRIDDRWWEVVHNLD